MIEFYLLELDSWGQEMKIILAFLVAVAIGTTITPANAGKLYDIVVQKLVINGSDGEVTVKMTNKTKKFISGMRIRCEFKDQNKKILEIGWRNNLTLDAGETDHFVVPGKGNMEKVRRADCNISF